MNINEQEGKGRGRMGSVGGTLRQEWVPAKEEDVSSHQSVASQPDQTLQARGHAVTGVCLLCVLPH